MNNIYNVIIDYLYRSITSIEAYVRETESSERAQASKTLPRIGLERHADRRTLSERSKIYVTYFKVIVK